MAALDPLQTWVTRGRCGAAIRPFLPTNQPGPEPFPLRVTKVAADEPRTTPPDDGARRLHIGVSPPTARWEKIGCFYLTRNTGPV